MVCESRAIDFFVVQKPYSSFYMIGSSLSAKKHKDTAIETFSTLLGSMVQSVAAVFKPGLYIFLYWTSFCHWMFCPDANFITKGW